MRGGGDYLEGRLTELRRVRRILQARYDEQRNHLLSERTVWRLIFRLLDARLRFLESELEDLKRREQR